VPLQEIFVLHWMLKSAQYKIYFFSQPEKLERDGTCSLLKLRLMGTQGVHMKGVLPWLVHWARCAGTRDFCPALDAQIGPVQNIFFFLTRETREGWTLLSVETEPNRDSRSTYERSPSVVGLLVSLCQYNRFLSCPGCSIGPEQFFSSPRALFQFILSPKLGGQSCRVASLLI
jgi:hypothetical protein